MQDHEKVLDMIAYSRMAFINRQNEAALGAADGALRHEPKNPDACQCAGNACMSLGRYDEAAAHYANAVKYDPDNGDRYYDLGYVRVVAGEAAEALKNLAMAESLGCSAEKLPRLYHVLGVLCFDIGRYGEALTNLEKAERLIGIDLDILHRKAVIYGIMEDTENCILTANQIKLIAPSLYFGYQLAFALLIQRGRLEAAGEELDRAGRYAALSMDFYFDCMTLELEQYKTDHDKGHLRAALAVTGKALRTLKPTADEAAECYICRAEIYLQMGEPGRAIDCLEAAGNPAVAYNGGFGISEEGPEPAEGAGPDGGEDKDKDREYLTEIEDVLRKDTEIYRLDEQEEFGHSPEQTDRTNRLYVEAHTVKKEFEKVIGYAKKLQESREGEYSHMGRYTEAKAMRELGLPEAEKKYAETIKFFRNALIRDSSDTWAAIYRIRCYIDTGDYDEAEQRCIFLTGEKKEEMLGEIRKARSGQGGG